MMFSKINLYWLVSVSSFLTLQYLELLLARFDAQGIETTDFLVVCGAIFLFSTASAWVGLRINALRLACRDTSVTILYKWKVVSVMVMFAYLVPSIALMADKLHDNYVTAGSTNRGGNLLLGYGFAGTVLLVLSTVALGIGGLTGPKKESKGDYAL